MVERGLRHQMELLTAVRLLEQLYPLFEWYACL